MSKNETSMTLWYWEQVGGTLVEEFTMVSKSRANERRAADGLIILGEENIRMPYSSKVNIEGKDVIVIQTKGKSLLCSFIQFIGILYELERSTLLERQRTGIDSAKRREKH